MKTYSRLNDRIPHSMYCFQCRSEFTVYQNGKHGKITHMSVCPDCAAKRAKSEYPDIRLRKVH